MQNPSLGLRLHFVVNVDRLAAYSLSFFAGLQARIV